MTPRPLTLRVASLFLAVVSLATLSGCACNAGSPGPARITGPLGDPVDGAVVPDPENSGPHQFPLTITTKRNFYPTSARINPLLSDAEHVTVVITGTRVKSSVDKSKKISPTNSGPHQDH